MMKSGPYYNTNLAYKEKYKEQPRKTTHIGRVKKKQIKDVKPAFYISLVACAFLILLFYVANLAKGAVVIFKINEKRKQLEIQQSETVRLNSILESKRSNYVDLEKYAKLNLNMKNRTINQIYYISTDKKNKCEKKDIRNENKNENSSKDKNIYSTIKNCLKSIVR